MLRYETHKDQIDKIFAMINSGRFYSLTFVKKGDGALRFLNGHRATYKKPDGTEGVVQNVGYDPKNYNLIRVWDRNALNPKTGERTGGYRSAALENILYIKSGNDVFDFVEENEIIKRFPYVENQLQSIKDRMKIETIVDDEAQGMMEELRGLEEGVDIMGIKELAEMIGRVGEGYFEAALNVLQNAFHRGGDEEVKKVFKSSTGLEIDDISRGKYVFKE